MSAVKNPRKAYDYRLFGDFDFSRFAGRFTEAEAPPWQKKKKTPVEREKERGQSIETAYAACSMNGDVKLSDLMEYMGKTRNTVKNYIKDHDGFVLEDGMVRRVSSVNS